MSSFEIIGGKPLSGEIYPQGAKNEALQVISAVLLSEEEIIIENIPSIRDVNKLIELLEYIGVKVHKVAQNTYSFKADRVEIDKIYTERYAQMASSLRGSVMLVGPLLARFKEAYIPTPGGDKIGRRRLDTHFTGFEKLGAKVAYSVEKKAYEVKSKGLNGCYMLLDEASVTGTANIVMAAVLAKGTTTIFNAACEPYLYQLCTMLNSMGAKISGVGSNLLTIEGVSELKGCKHRLLPDMIEVGSFIGLAAMTKSDITIKQVNLKQLGIIPDTFRRLGIKIEEQDDDLHIPAQEIYEVEKFMDGSIMTISDAPWPG
ncbi:MAG: UDP-N-acetylglucosamine 1-carboxyvinyltransferase, partial [Bacteroidales bacterium]|nr:UDP-N-acetylglucosamine 1-carboxyvinyltransferase [Bacteroidales bacterium]